MAFPALVAVAQLGFVDGIGGDAFIIDPAFDGVEELAGFLGDEGFDDGWETLAGGFAGLRACCREWRSVGHSEEAYGMKR